MRAFGDATSTSTETGVTIFRLRSRATMSRKVYFSAGKVETFQRGRQIFPRVISPRRLRAPILAKTNTPAPLKRGGHYLSYLGTMSGDFLGGGLVFAIAATLWVVYLIPTWLRRRTFDATERNAVRMQQTIRALAETSVLPAEMRVEASARGVAEQKRLLRDAENHARVQLRAATARAIGYDDSGVRAKARRRGQRLFVSAVLLASVIGIATGTSFMLSNQGWQLLALSCVAFAVAIICQNELSGTVAVNARRQMATGLTSQAFADHAPLATAVDSRSWTPTALPRPMHLSQGSIAAAVIASQAAAERLRLSGAEAALVERLRAAGNVTPAIRVSAPAPTPVVGRFATMGVLGDTGTHTQTGHLDLDAALRRRRAAG